MAFLEDVGMDQVGLNPDIGNLVRRQGAVEPWEQIGELTLPFANYWHVKNIMRARTAAGEMISFPAPLISGVIDYRAPVAEAVRVGFSGPVIVEHYGGDGLGLGAVKREYVRDLFQ